MSLGVAPQMLVDRLVAENYISPKLIPPDATFHRTYAGLLQRQAGAWSWYIVAGSREVLAGFEPVTRLLTADEFVLRREPGVARNFGAWIVDIA